MKQVGREYKFSLESLLSDSYQEEESVSSDSCSTETSEEMPSPFPGVNHHNVCPSNKIHTMAAKEIADQLSWLK